LRELFKQRRNHQKIREEITMSSFLFLKLDSFIPLFHIEPLQTSSEPSVNDLNSFMKGWGVSNKRKEKKRKKEKNSLADLPATQAKRISQPGFKIIPIPFLCSGLGCIPESQLFHVTGRERRRVE